MLKRSASLLFVLGMSACSGNDFQVLALAPDIAIDKDVIEFGDVIVGTSATQVLTVINAGRSDLDLESVTVVDGGSDYSIELPAIVVPPGEFIEVGITLIPSVTGDMSRDLLIVSDDPENGELIVPIAANSVDVPVPDIELSDTALDFGAVAAGSSSPMAFVVVSNIGGAELSIDQIQILGSGAFEIVQPAAFGDGFAVAADGGQENLVVQYYPTVETGDSATIVLQSNDPDEPTVEIALEGNGGGATVYPEAHIDCPGVVYPPADILLDGSGSFDPGGSALTYMWDLVEVPTGSATALYDPATGSPSVPTEETAALLADLAGDYEVQLRVRNDSDVISAPAVCRFSAVPENKVHVELVWDETNADLDLHLAEEGYELYQTPGDANWCNPNPDWGSTGETADNPLLDLDSEQGPGPENIYLPEPADGDYTVRVHYYRDSGANDVNATVKIWIEGRLFSQRSMNIDTGRVWEVGYIRWPEAVFVPNTTEPEIHRGAVRCP